MDKVHKLLERQLRRCDITLGENPQIDRFVDAVDKTYKQLSKEIEIMDTNSTNMIEKISNYNDNLENIIESIDSFNYHVSHDLKTSAINSISLIRMLIKYIDRKDENKVQDVLHRLESNSELSLRVIEKYLELSKYETQVQNSVRKEFKLCKVVKNLVNDIQFEEKIKVTVECNDGDILLIDELSLQSMLQNFITNAYKYSRPGIFPELHISMEDSEDFKIIKFKDNGIGIDLERNHSKIFKPFIRINGSDLEGDGIGLYLIKKIIVNHGGTIEVESEVGTGTTFIVSIPKQ